MKHTQDTREKTPALARLGYASSLLLVLWGGVSLTGSLPFGWGVELSTSLTAAAALWVTGLLIDVMVWAFRRRPSRRRTVAAADGPASSHRVNLSRNLSPVERLELQLREEQDRERRIRAVEAKRWPVRAAAPAAAPGDSMIEIHFEDLPDLPPLLAEQVHQHLGKRTPPGTDKISPRRLADRYHVRADAPRYDARRAPA